MFFFYQALFSLKSNCNFPYKGKYDKDKHLLSYIILYIKKWYVNFIFLKCRKKSSIKMWCINTQSHEIDELMKSIKKIQKKTLF